MPDVEKYDYSVADDLFDQDILTERPCPKCSGLIVSHPDCTESCSKCDYRAK